MLLLSSCLGLKFVPLGVPQRTTAVKGLGRVWGIEFWVWPVRLWFEASGFMIWSWVSGTRLVTLLIRRLTGPN